MNLSKRKLTHKRQKTTETTTRAVKSKAKQDLKPVKLKS